MAVDRTCALDAVYEDIEALPYGTGISFVLGEGQAGSFRSQVAQFLTAASKMSAFQGTYGGIARGD